MSSLVMMPENMAKMQELCVQGMKGQPSTMFPPPSSLAALASLRKPMVPATLGELPPPVGDDRRGIASVGDRRGDAAVGDDRRGIVPVGDRRGIVDGAVAEEAKSVAVAAIADGAVAEEAKSVGAAKAGDGAVAEVAKSVGAAEAVAVSAPPPTKPDVLTVAVSAPKPASSTKPKVLEMLDELTKSSRKPFPAEAAETQTVLKRPAAALALCDANDAKRAATPSRSHAVAKTMTPIAKTVAHAKPQVNHEASRSQYLVRFGPGLKSQNFKYKGAASQKAAKKAADAALAKFLKGK